MDARARTAVSALFLAGVLAVAGCSGGGESSGSSNPPSGQPLPPPTPPVNQLRLESVEEAARFLNLATFGASQEQAQAIVGQSASQWLAAELNKPVRLYTPGVAARVAADSSSRDHFSDEVWTALIENDDQLRTRMTFALSQIVVANTNEGGSNRQLRNAFFADAIASNALGNYRDLLQDVTYTPMMAQFLTYYRNRKGDEATGRMPDENYAREIMQLFTIGLVELNMDGTPRLDGSGQPIETYTNADVEGLARVFTGLSGAGPNFRNTTAGWEYQPLVMFETEHSPLEKTFLGTTIAAGTPGDESIRLALDALFQHPNVPPFIARQLIQRFTSSNPPPAYVERVATAFATGRFQSDDGRSFGTGQRGDLAATIAAVLLDDYVFGASAGSALDYGKVREPVLNFTHWARAFDVAEINPFNENMLGNTSSTSSSLGQHPFRAPSVFNFYRPGFVPPSTESGANGMTVPEFQLVNEGSTIGYLNFMTRYVFDDSPRRSAATSFTPDYSTELALADNAEALADHLNSLLMAGRMEADTRRDIIESLAAYPVDMTNPEEDRERRVKVAILIAINAPSYRIQR